MTIIAVGGLGRTENENDYSRYLPAYTIARKAFWAGALGSAIPSVILELLGLPAYTVTDKTVGIAQLGIPQSFDSVGERGGEADDGDNGEGLVPKQGALAGYQAVNPRAVSCRESGGVDMVLR